VLGGRQRVPWAGRGSRSSPAEMWGGGHESKNDCVQTQNGREETVVAPVRRFGGVLPLTPEYSGGRTQPGGSPLNPTLILTLFFMRHCPEEISPNAGSRLVAWVQPIIFKVRGIPKEGGDLRRKICYVCRPVRHAPNWVKEYGQETTRSFGGGDSMRSGFQFQRIPFGECRTRTNVLGGGAVFPFRVRSPSVAVPWTAGPAHPGGGGPRGTARSPCPWWPRSSSWGRIG